MKKRVGEVTVAVAIAIALGSLIAGLILPKLSLFHSSSKLPKQTHAWTKQTETVTPLVVTADKKPVVVSKVERSFESGIEEKERKFTLLERIGNFISHLTWWSASFILISLLFLGGTPIVWLWRKFLVMKQALKNTVSAIRETDDETFSKLKPKLEAKHDVRDKRVIDDIKKELHT